MPTLSETMDRFLTETALSPSEQEQLRSALGILLGITAGKIPALSDGGRFDPDRTTGEYLGTAANQAAMLAFSSAKRKDWCRRLDTGQSFVLTASNPALAGSWTAFAQFDTGIFPAATVTASTVLNSGHHFVFVDCAAGDVDITLPDPATCPGRFYTVKRIDEAACLCRVVPAAGSIDFDTFLSLEHWESAQLVSNGTNWYIF